MSVEAFKKYTYSINKLCKEHIKNIGKVESWPLGGGALCKHLQMLPVKEVDSV